MSPSLDSELEGPPLSASPAKKSPSALNSSNSTSAAPKSSPPGENNSPAPTTNAPTPKKPLLSPPPPPPDDATSSGNPPPGSSPPPPKQSPPTKRPPPPPPPPSKTPPPASQDSPPYNSSPPRVASPPPQGGGGTNLPTRSPQAPTGPPLTPPFYPSTTPRTPPDDHTTLPTPPSNSPSGSSSPRPSPNLETPTSNVAYKTAPPKPNPSPHGQVHIAAAGAFAIVAFAAVIFFLQRQRKRTGRYNTAYVAPSPHNSSAGTSRSNDGEILHSSPEGGGIGNPKTWFTYEELNKATNGFASQNILGSGGFGCVYKGGLQDGQEVAVKKLKDDSGQGDREFKAEVEIITRVHHRHLVSLVGYCISEYQKLLVYEYVPNNTLHHHLHDSNKPVMEWPLRAKVACGSAHGIAYLHEDCIPHIIHRDIKSANILLDNNFEAKVADFGLAKLVEEWESKSHVSTRVVGTFGYMAPEYARSGKLTEKSDVFSFGVVLLELITGRKPVDETRPLGHESLVEWARPLMTEVLESHNADELVDPRLGGKYDRDEMFRMIEAAAACVRHSATKRPKMTQLVREFDSWGEPSDLTNGVKPGQSRVYDSREQSAEIRMFERMRFDSQDYYDSESSWTSKGTRTG